MKLLQKSYLLKGIGAVIIILIIFNINVQKIIYHLNEIKLGYYLFGLSLFIPMFFIKILRWQYILRKQNISVSIKDSVLFYSAGMFLGAVTPGRVGEIIRTFYIKNKGHSFGVAFFGVFIDRLSDIFLLIILGIIGMLYFTGLFDGRLLIMNYVLISIAIIIGILYVIKNKLNYIFYRLVQVIVSKEYRDDLEISFNDFINSFKVLKTKDYLIIIIITALSWVFYYLEMYFFSEALNLNISLLLIIMIISIVTIISLIPITVAGIGTRDAALVLLFSQIYISKESAIAFSSLVLFMIIFNMILCSFGWFLQKDNL